MHEDVAPAVSTSVLGVQPNNAASIVLTASAFALTISRLQTAEIIQAMYRVFDKIEK